MVSSFIRFLEKSSDNYPGSGFLATHQTGSEAGVGILDNKDIYGRGQVNGIARACVRAGSSKHTVTRLIIFTAALTLITQVTGGGQLGRIHGTSLTK
ncbi:MAG: hypothetical protein DRH12_00575 [Deltaproteobacteria bacterium]|nr:MAG: hypothetical protein DRH12_00575 [Deltaproteobacteria bacterium]